MIRVIKQSDAGFAAAVGALQNLLRGGELSAAGDDGCADIPAIVADVIKDVRLRGDDAVIDLTKKIEHVTLTPDKLRVSPDEIAAAHSNIDKDFLALIRRVTKNIREYQEHIRITAPPMLKRGSRQLGVRYTPIGRVGVYVPGMKAVYPSTVLMTVVPALVAGVPEIAMISPPTGGDVNLMVLALASELGITEVYRVSGTAGIAAAAIGTKSIRPVSKIVGPGNAFIAETKRQVSGMVGIDSIAGASEVLIITDESAPADWIAADLLGQAEHNPGSAVLVTTSQPHADAVVTALTQQLPNLSRSEETRVMLEKYCAIIVTDDLDSACGIANDFAPEHLQIITNDDDAVLDKICNAGAIFIGANTPVALGDYYAGPSHVIPTRGTAKFFAPLSVNDFMKASSVIRYNSDALNADADDVIDFATREGFTAHANTIRLRKTKYK